ncbi:MAG: alpha/beta fold hydrolase [Flavobacteriales bacterium]|nr:alpha/beta fold hydrolase [Flavobacteriales bacterium]
MITPPPWLDRSEFPFTSRCFDHGDGRMHYVDEGQGPVLLFVHGTPDQSFGFRHLIKALRVEHRCVSIDHLGFGLSDKPVNSDYTVAAHARRLQGSIDHLGLIDITLVVTDFGGGIGLQHALEHPANVKGIVLYNTWLWDLMTDKRFRWPSVIMNSWFGRFLYLQLGFSVNVMMLPPMARNPGSQETPMRTTRRPCQMRLPARQRSLVYNRSRTLVRSGTHSGNASTG